MSGSVTRTYRFLDTADDERRFDRLVSAIYERDLGVAVNDEADPVYEASFHRTLVCETAGRFVGGLKAYVAGGDLGGQLPMERDGVAVSAFHTRTFPDNPRRSEICRVVVDDSHRGSEVHDAFLRVLDPELRALCCPVIYWVANAQQTLNSHRAARRMGLRPHVIERVRIVRPGSPSARELLWSYTTTR